MILITACDPEPAAAALEAVARDSAVVIKGSEHDPAFVRQELRLSTAYVDVLRATQPSQKAIDERVTAISDRELGSSETAYGKSLSRKATCLVLQTEYETGRPPTEDDIGAAIVREVGGHFTPEALRLRERASDLIRQAQQTYEDFNAGKLQRAGLGIYVAAACNIVAG